MKNIQIGDYWYVNYQHKNPVRKYKGIVQVKGMSASGDQYSCILARGHSDWEWVNYFSGHCFEAKDFTKRATEADFYYQQYRWYAQQSHRAFTKFDRLSK